MAAARELRYTSRSAVYGDLAYDLDRAALEHALRHAGEAPRRQAEEAPAPKARPRARVRSLTKAEARQGLAVTVLMGYIQLTAISAEVVDLQNQLEALETENVSLTARHEQMFDLSTVKEAAEAAGMAKPGSGQVYYIDLSEGDSAVVYQQKEANILSRLLTSLNHGIYAVVEYFD